MKIAVPLLQKCPEDWGLVRAAKRHLQNTKDYQKKKDKEAKLGETSNKEVINKEVEDLTIALATMLPVIPSPAVADEPTTARRSSRIQQKKKPPVDATKK
jgi:hypothetical protein